MGDPMRLVYLLKQYPYHVSTLLQGNDGLNRQFWLAGYLYIKSLVRKGTFRTALEWARFLYSMDPDDPYAMRHLIHGLAVRAHESRWLVDFLDHVDERSDMQDVVYLRQTLVPALLQMGDVEGARNHLKQGVEQLPWLYCSLFQELNLDAPPSIWGISPDSDTKTLWTKLYILQTKDLWKNAQATCLLQEVTKDMGRVDLSAPPNQDPPVDRAVTRLCMLEGQGPLLALAPKALAESQPNYEFDPLPPPEAENIFTSRGTQLPWRDRRQQEEEQDAELLAQMNNLMARQAEFGAAPDDDDDDDDDEIMALRLADDEELQRDLEAHRRRADQPGMLAALMQVLGLGRDGDAASSATGTEEDETGSPPGAWPADEDGAGERSS
ncbi:hypothetical protein XA68_14894 [Ophiocordyceps unilateralis]|uniref:Uncharacterized protein n=1 Tax=Ophiocordyceps unilateralis TaxID=268505 RepID=A0A2A9P9M1_OPHUN|nr:hypothetical protein XA68_14894 [Ophiocordyceps unilateralis]